LAPGESREVSVTLSERCQITIGGQYTVTPRVEIPASGRRSFSGTLEAAPLEFEVIAPETPEEPFHDDEE
jgi:hypothetical protein